MSELLLWVILKSFFPESIFKKQKPSIKGAFSEAEATNKFIVTEKKFLSKYCTVAGLGLPLEAINDFVGHCL